MNYIPYGDEWEEELMKWNKRQLIAFLRRVLKSRVLTELKGMDIKPPDDLDVIAIGDLKEIFVARVIDGRWHFKDLTTAHWILIEEPFKWFNPSDVYRIINIDDIE